MQAALVSPEECVFISDLHHYPGKGKVSSATVIPITVLVCSYGGPRVAYRLSPLVLWMAHLLLCPHTKPQTSLPENGSLKTHCITMCKCICKSMDPEVLVSEKALTNPTNNRHTKLQHLHISGEVEVWLQGSPTQVPEVPVAAAQVSTASSLAQRDIVDRLPPLERPVAHALSRAVPRAHATPSRGGAREQGPPLELSQRFVYPGLLLPTRRTLPRGGLSGVCLSQAEEFVSAVFSLPWWWRA